MGWIVFILPHFAKKSQKLCLIQKNVVPLPQINNTMRRYLLLIIGLSVVLSSLMAQFLNSNTDLPVIQSALFGGSEGERTP